MDTTARTTNGALQYHIDSVAEFFTQVGAAAPIDDLYTLFAAAMQENKDLAVRALLWSYDCRGGAGRRSNFIALLPRAINNKTLTADEAKNIIKLVPELGRWDAVYKIAESCTDRNIQCYALDMICKALLEHNALCAKWMPRKGLIAARIRGYFNKVLHVAMSAKQYRQLLVKSTRVVETQMSANKWHEIDYASVPSVAGARYRNAFTRHDMLRHAEYIRAVAAGNAKMNTAVLYPHDIARMLKATVPYDVIDTAWKALPDIPDILDNVLCMADVSGSMTTCISGAVTALDVAVTLGIYFSERAQGPWRNKILTYSAVPKIISMQEDSFTAKYKTIQNASPNPYNTNIRAAYRAIVQFGKENNVPDAQMPKALLILSDMQFDSIGPKSIDSDLKRTFRDAGYSVPHLIYWNLDSHCNGVPICGVLSEDSVEYSGYSAKGVQTVLGSRSMLDVVLETLMVDRYQWQ